MSKKIDITHIRNILNEETLLAYGNALSGNQKKIVFVAFQYVFRIYDGVKVVQRFGGCEIDKALDYYNNL